MHAWDEKSLRFDKIASLKWFQSDNFCEPINFVRKLQFLKFCLIVFMCKFFPFEHSVIWIVCWFYQDYSAMSCGLHKFLNMNINRNGICVGMCAKQPLPCEEIDSIWPLRFFSGYFSLPMRKITSLKFTVLMKHLFFLRRNE